MRAPAGTHTVGVVLLKRMLAAEGRFPAIFPGATAACSPRPWALVSTSASTTSRSTDRSARPRSATRRAAARSSRAARRPPPTSRRVRRGFSGRSRAAPTAVRSTHATSTRSSPPSAVRGARGATSMPASGPRSSACWSSSTSCTASRSIRRRPRAPYRLSDLELASRLSFFLWSSIPDDELLQAAEQGRLQDPAVLDAAGPADARDDRGEGARDQLRRAVAVPAEPADRHARSVRVPGLGRQPAAGDGARDGAVPREPAARRPRRDRAADGRLHVRQRAAGAPLRHARTSTAATSGA